MPHVQVSPQAEQYLIEFWLFIAEDSPENADRFLDRIADAAERVAEFRDMGRERPGLADDIKSFPLAACRTVSVRPLPLPVVRSRLVLPRRSACIGIQF